jgi:hypothetical protein
MRITPTPVVILILLLAAGILVQTAAGRLGRQFDLLRKREASTPMVVPNENTAESANDTNVFF